MYMKNQKHYKNKNEKQDQVIYRHRPNAPPWAVACLGLLENQHQHMANPLRKGSDDPATLENISLRPLVGRHLLAA